MATAKKAVIAKGQSELALSDERPSWMKDSDRGNEGVGFEDLTIPRLDVIQDLSPQHKKNKPEYIEGAEPGMLFNTVTKQLYGSEVLFVPVFYRKEWVVWKDIDFGGGFKGAYDSEAEAFAAVQELAEDGLEVVDTGQQFGLILNPEGVPEEVVLSMSKSKMKPCRQLNSMVKIRGGDRWSSAYQIKAVEAQNAAGQDYWNLSIRPIGYASEETYALGERLYQQVKGGVRDVNRVSGEEDKEDRDF